MMRFHFAFAVMSLAATTSTAAPSATSEVTTIMASAKFKQARATLDAQYDRYVDEIIELTEIAAPPFNEATRAKAYADKFRALGLKDVTIDPEGNVLGLRPGTDPAASLIVIDAHMDTVFPEGTPVKVRRDGTKLYAPGVQDDTRGLCNLLAYIRALDAAGIRTRHPILFVGSVGEEGRGDLRGMRYLFTKSAYKGKIGAMLAIDGNDPERVVASAVGSKRYHVVFHGPGGHSYGAFGIVNPMAAMAATVTDLYAIDLPAKPKTTFAASVAGGGTSVNAIPSEAWIDIDMRSESATSLAELEKRFLAVAEAAVDRENRSRSIKVGKITVEFQPIGDRPAGATAPDSSLVATTAAALAALGYQPRYEASSTNSNIPMSLGVPALTIGSGGDAARTHSTDEWTDIAKPEGLRGMMVGFVALLAAAEMDTL